MNTAKTEEKLTVMQWLLHGFCRDCSNFTIWL